PSYSPINLAYRLANAGVATVGLRSCRLRLPVLWLFRCFLPAWLRLSLPLAVTLKRLRDALWVFIFGMVVSLSGPRPGRCHPAGHAGPGRGSGGSGREQAS